MCAARVLSVGDAQSDERSATNEPTPNTSKNPARRFCLHVGLVIVVWGPFRPGHRLLEALVSTVPADTLIAGVVLVWATAVVMSVKWTLSMLMRPLPDTLEGFGGAAAAPPAGCAARQARECAERGWCRRLNVCPDPSGAGPANGSRSFRTERRVAATRESTAMGGASRRCRESFGSQ